MASIVKVIGAVPAVRPVTTPVAIFTSAVDVAPEVHEPNGVASASVMVALPAHTVKVLPVMGWGSGFTFTGVVL